MSSTKFFNLEEVVRDWAWGYFDQNATGRQKKLRQKDKKEPRRFLHLDVDWSEARFHDVTQWTPLTVDDGEVDRRKAGGTGGVEAAQAAAAGQNNISSEHGDNQPLSTKSTGSGAMPESSRPQTSVLFETTFTNNTKGPQEYTMRTEKRTLSSIATTVERGLMRGVEMGVKLSAPGELFEANVGYKRELTLTNTDGETFEEELTWGVESQIRVDEFHVAEASLVVDERRQKANFEIVTSISGPLYFTFTAPSDNNSLVKSVCNDVAYIVAEFLEAEVKKPGGGVTEFVKIDGSTVVVRTKGSCRFRYGVRQRIHVDQKQIGDSGTK